MLIYIYTNIQHKCHGFITSCFVLQYTVSGVLGAHGVAVQKLVMEDNELKPGQTLLERNMEEHAVVKRHCLNHATPIVYAPVGIKAILNKLVLKYLQVIIYCIL